MKTKKGFTLLELLVAMAIIAVLVALAIFGILQVQKNSRETQRRKALEDVNIGINDFYSRYGQYPRYVDFKYIDSEGDNNARICEDAATCLDDVIVPLNNSARANRTNDKTTTNATYYEYTLDDDGYKLAFCTEDEEIVNGGTSLEDFTEVDMNCSQ
jgi:prepilin-type N-terminal cleavage/methylation domain-containing protein